MAVAVLVVPGNEDPVPNIIIFGNIFSRFGDILRPPCAHKESLKTSPASSSESSSFSTSSSSLSSVSSRSLVDAFNRSELFLSGNIYVVNVDMGSITTGSLVIDSDFSISSKQE